MTKTMDNGLNPISYRYMTSARIVGLSFIFILFIIGTKAVAETKTTTLPLSIDYPLLQSLTIQAAFTDPGKTARLFKSNDGCTSVTISDPYWREQNGKLQLETRVALTAGKGFGDSCLFPVEWQGYVHLDQMPVIYPNWQLGFQPLASAIFDIQRKPALLSGVITKLVEQWVFPYLAQIRIDLAPPVADLKQALMPMFSAKIRKIAQKTIDSMRPGEVSVHSKHAGISIIIETASTRKEAPAGSPAPLSQEEVADFIRLWETWDAFLVHIILALTEKPLHNDEKQTLLDTLLETRHLFSVELTKEFIEKDFVKAQFLWTWEQLSPIFRRHLTEENPSKGLAYLTFFTALDALAVLDTLGPSLGIEISRDGLIRMARLMGKLPPDQLSYPFGTDQRLRDLLGFEPEEDPVFDDQQPLQEPPDQDTTGQSDTTGQKGVPWQKRLLTFFSSPAVVYAAENPSNDHTAKKSRIKTGIKSSIKTWIVPKTGVDHYVKRVRSLLKKTADKVMINNATLKEYKRLFNRIVISTAWQESCFRQFHAKNRKLVYLRSYNGSSVGLMQINERVWRGIYDVNKLRWDIHYNAKAGCEILATYLQRYALKKPQRITSLKPAELAGAVYAMYNGGPRQFDKFLYRLNTGKLFVSDRLYKEKYVWVADDKWSMINQCLIVG